tara:strand:+ start:3132 stop:3752 length:621 start_codon:yes stop_codon:yes gene_type:complete
MLKIKIITIIISLLFCSSLYSIDYSFNLKFGGFSKHFKTETNNIYNESTGKDYDYNESHNGIGFDISKELENKNLFRYIFWYMKDSYDKDSFHFGAGYSYNIQSSFFEKIYFNIDVLYMKRSEFLSKETIYIDNDLYKFNRSFSIEDKNILAPIPSITIYLTERFNLDLSLLTIPSEFNQINPQTGTVKRGRYWDIIGFIRFGYKF